MLSNIEMSNVRNHSLHLTRLPVNIFNRVSLCCAAAEVRRGGKVPTGRGVMQHHLDEQQTAAVEACLLPHLPAHLSLASCWVSVTTPGAFHNWHWHTGCDYSAIVYLDDQSHQIGDCGKTIFQMDSNAVQRRCVIPKKGYLLAFDAKLPHRTRPIKKGIRRTLALDFRKTES